MEPNTSTGVTVSVHASDLCLTLPYKVVGKNHILADIYIPSSVAVNCGPDARNILVPPLASKSVDSVLKVSMEPSVSEALVASFLGSTASHLLGMVGLQRSKAEVVFISADYRLIPPATGHDILADITDLFAFLATRANGLILQNLPASCVQLDPNAIAVAGTSSGGLCAYLAAMHASPKPTAVLSMYGMGGDMFTPHYLTVKTEPFFRGREILDPASFARFLYPNTQAGQSSVCPSDSVAIDSVISGSPLAYHPSTSFTPGYPANLRMQLTRLYLQLGVCLDYYTGRHNPSLSLQLRNVLMGAAEHEDKEWRARVLALISKDDLVLFPQFHSALHEWPPTMLVHGTADTAVKIQESRHLHMILKESGVHVILKTVDGQEHSFDYQANAEELLGRVVFDEAVEFLLRHLNT